MAEDVLLLIGYSLMTASLSWFIHKCYQEGMIFRRICLFLTYWWIRWWRKEERWKRKLIKLFMCPYCYGTWIALIFFLLKFGFKVELFLFLGMNYLFTEIIFNTLIKNK